MAAELPIVIKELNETAIREYLKHPDLMAALDEYILFADRRLIPSLQKLERLQRKVQPGISVKELFRGSGNWGPQESLGSDGMRVGESKSFKSSDKVISTTTSLEIARAFGPTVVKISLDTSASFLIVSDELSFIISRRRNLDEPMTQKEVILLPPISLNYTVLEQKKKGFFW